MSRRSIILITIALFVAPAFGCSLVPTSPDSEVRAGLEGATDAQLERIINEARFAQGAPERTKMILSRSRVLVEDSVTPLGRAYPLAKKIYLERQRAWLATLPEGRIKKTLANLLEYEPKHGQKFDRYGDILTNLPSGREITLLGYASVKEDIFGSDSGIRGAGPPEKSPVSIDILTPLDLIPQKARPSLSLARKRHGEECEEDYECLSRQCSYPPISIGGLGMEAPAIEDGITLQARKKRCVESCYDDVVDQDETDVDCGGICVTKYDIKCTVNRSCNAGSDCRSDICVEGVCLSVPLGESDDLNEVNALFYKGNYHPQGLMYHAGGFYASGGDKHYFSTLPHLTPVKDQGKRGTCLSFANVAGAEIAIRGFKDLSEQNQYFQRVYAKNPLKHGLPIGLEKEWPYNGSPCFYRSYETPLVNKPIPCSDTEHQGIPLSRKHGSPQTTQWGPESDMTASVSGKSTAFEAGALSIRPQFGPFWPIKKSTSGRCVIMDDSVKDTLSDEGEITVQTIEALKRHLNEGHAVRFSIDLNEKPGLRETYDGFVEETLFGDGGGHAMLIIAHIPRSAIPHVVREHTHFNDEDYFIVKNSWGIDYGDGGMMYFPESMMREYGRSFWPIRWDGASEVYDGCPPSPVTVSPVLDKKVIVPLRNLDVR